MADWNIVILVQTSEALRWCCYRDRIGGKPLIEHFLTWWNRCESGHNLCLVYYEDSQAEEIYALARAHDITALRCPVRGEGATIQFASAHLDADSIAVVPLGIGLLPVGFLGALWDHHAATLNAFTYVKGCPEGTAPYVVTSELAALFAQLAPPAGNPTLKDAIFACLPTLTSTDGVDFGFRVSAEPFDFHQVYQISLEDMPKKVSPESPHEMEVVGPYLVDAFERDDEREKFEILAAMRRVRVQDADVSYGLPGATGRTNQPANRDRLRLLCLSAFGGYSGGEEAFVRMISSLDQDRIQLHGCAPWEGKFAEALRKHCAEFYCPERDIAAPSLRNIRYIADVLAAVQPDCIHINGAPGSAVTTAVGLACIPTIQHVRTGHPQVYAEALAIASAVIACSEYSRRQILRNVDIDSGKIHVVYDGIDTQLFCSADELRQESRRRFGFASDSKVILMVGRYVPRKRHDILISAFSEVLKDFPEAEVVFVGEDEGQAKYYNQLQKMIDDFGIREKVHCLGFQDDIRAIEAAADVQVLCSEEEPLGICILESLALGVPAIATEGGGLNDILRNEEHCRFVRQSDPVALADAICSIFTDEESARAMAHRGQVFVRAELNSHRAAVATMTIYERVAGRKSAVSRGQPASASVA